MQNEIFIDVIEEVLWDVDMFTINCLHSNFCRGSFKYLVCFLHDLVISKSANLNTSTSLQSKLGEYAPFIESVITLEEKSHNINDCISFSSLGWGITCIRMQTKWDVLLWENNQPWSGVMWHNVQNASKCSIPFLRIFHGWQSLSIKVKHVLFIHL